jgi:hypothetical protein
MIAFSERHDMPTSVLFFWTLKANIDVNIMLTSKLSSRLFFSSTLSLAV